MKVICPNCRTMNLLPDTMADAPISRMTCARCGSVMDLPEQGAPPPDPEPWIPLPPPAPKPVPPPTVAASVTETTEAPVNDAAAPHPRDEFESDYDVPYSDPRPDRTGRLFKYLSVLLVIIALGLAVVLGLLPYLRQKFPGGFSSLPFLSSRSDNNNVAPTVPPTPSVTPRSGNSAPNANGNLNTNANTGNANLSASTGANANANLKNANTTAANQETANRNDAGANSNRTVPTPPANVNKPAPVDTGSGNITIQVGSHPTAEEANRQVAQLQAKGIAARMVRAEIPGRGTWYRVQVGRFPTREAANQYAAQLRSKGLSQFYITEATQ